MMESNYTYIEASTTCEDDQVMMSRLNWMTYLKVLFDKLVMSVAPRTTYIDLT